MGGATKGFRDADAAPFTTVIMAESGAKHDVGYHALVYENGFRATDVLS